MSSHLTPKELDVLRYLTQHANRSRFASRDACRPSGDPTTAIRWTIFASLIKNLRKKIEANPDHPQYIKTEPWVGYRFNGTPESA